MKTTKAKFKLSIRNETIDTKTIDKLYADETTAVKV